jgi:legumain
MWMQVRAFEASCGELTQYGMKHMRAFANICNAGFEASKMATVTAEACAVSAFGSRTWHPVTEGFSA